MLFLIIGMLVSLLALMAMQWYWLREIKSSRQAQFDQTVAEALRQLNYSLEAMEASKLLNQALHQEQWVKRFDSIAGTSVLLVRDTIQLPLRKPALANRTVVLLQDSLLGFGTMLDLARNSRQAAQITAQVDFPSKLDCLIFRAPATASYSEAFSFRYEAKTDSIVQHLFATDSMLQKQLKSLPKQRVIIRADADAPFTGLTLPKQSPESGTLTVKKRKSTEKSIVQRTIPVDSLLAKVTRDFIAPKQPIEKRISSAQFDSLLSEQLQRSGIKLAYRYYVSREQGDSTSFIFGNPQAAVSGTHFYQTRLFPNDLFHQNEQLMLYFLDETSYLSKGISALYVLSGLLLLLVAGIFYAAFRYLLHHKRLSEVKSDFINNMSHEFKTPLATINLATDALANDKVKHHPELIDKYLGIIKSENRRMNQHVELVLQTARLERKELKLQLAEVDLKSLLEHAIELMQMQFEEKQGSIELVMEVPLLLQADETHLLHVVTNLLDNSLKYCTKIPHVTIKTEVHGNKVSIHFTDNGMGMSKENIDHIFDQFYRVPTGNIHNVKGFGLGLSYAKAIVEAHGGKLVVESELGIGSTFSLHLLLNQSAHA